jgi:hypothetical protein
MFIEAIQVIDEINRLKREGLYNNDYYYTSPSQQCFDDLKKHAINLWKSKNASRHYIEEKLSMIDDINNEKGNFMFIFAMFDCKNQAIIRKNINKETLISIEIRLAAGGAYD